MSVLTRSPFRALAVAGAVSIVVALSACSAPQASAPGITSTEIRIGTHAPASGPARDAANATKAYFAYVNAKGGVNGRKIVYTIEDDGGDPAGAAAAVKKLVEKDGVFAVVGGTGTTTHAAAADYLNARKVPDLFVESGSTRWDDAAKYPWTFGYSADYVVEAKILGNYAQQTAPSQTSCLLAEEGELGDAFVSGLPDVLGSNGLVASERVAAGADVTQQVAALHRSGCTIAFVGADDAGVAAALTAAAGIGWTPTWLVPSAGADQAILSQRIGATAPQLMSGLLSTCILPWGADNRWATQFRVIDEQYDNAAAFDLDTVLGMSVGYTFVETLVKTGDNPTRAGVVHTLESGRVIGNGLMPITYSATYHGAYTGAGVTRISGDDRSYVGHPYLAAPGGSQVIDYVGKGIPFSGDGIPRS
jgi:branched-chain amino acid transport system substrate-binding protein